MQGSYLRFIEVSMYFIGCPANGAYTALNNPENVRSHRVHFGVCPCTSFVMWNLILLKQLSPAEAKTLDPHYYFMTLYFLKVYPSNSIIGGKTWRDTKTVRFWIWKYIKLMASLLSELVSFWQLFH